MSISEVVSFIGQEMLLNSADEDRLEFVTKVSKLAEEDPQMLKLMQVWMKIADYDLEAQKDVEYSMKDYLRRKALWAK